MKKSEFYIQLDDDKIKMIQTGNIYHMKDIKHVEIKDCDMKKTTRNVLLDTLSSSLGTSFHDGNRKVMVQLKIKLENGEEYITLNNDPLVYNTFDYHEYRKHAQNLKKALKKDYGLK